MALWRNRLLFAVLWIVPALCIRGAPVPTEQRAFEAAVQSWNLGFYEVAEKGFGEFVQTYTNSPQIPEAILLQAEARIQQSNYTGAIELLSSRMAVAGTNWADQYVYWQAPAPFAEGEM